MCRILAIANIKGGVGKTTTTANLAAALAERGRRVLAVDLDPQSSLTISLGFQPERLGKTIGGALTAGAISLDSLVVPTADHFDLLPANHQLRMAERELEDGRVRVFAVRDALEPLRSRYDYILLDCPASAGILTGNALAAATEVIIPFPADYLALRALEWAMLLIQETQHRLNPNLHIAGLLLTMYDSRTRHAREIVSTARASYAIDLRFFSRPIHQSVRLREATREGRTILQYAPTSQPADDYRHLALEVEEGIQEPAVMDVYAAIQRGRAAMESGKMQEAYAAFCLATELDPALIEGWIGRAQTAAPWPEAVRCFADALSLDDSCLEAKRGLEIRLTEILSLASVYEIPELVTLGHYMKQAGQLAYADQLYQRVTQVKPDHVEAWLGRARAATDVGTSLAFYQRALQLEPTNAAAQTELHKALDRARAEASSLVEEGRSLLHEGATRDAHALFQRSVSLDPENDEGWLGMARTTEDAREALEWVKQSLKLNPNRTEARNLYHWLWVPEQNSRMWLFSWKTLISITLAVLVLILAVCFIWQQVIH